jgi:uncharacterized protein YkwD
MLLGLPVQPTRKQMLRRQLQRKTRLFVIPEDKSCGSLQISELSTSTVSLHGLINQERQARDIPPLIRSTDLDKLAQLHANSMASDQKVTHTVSNVDELKHLLQSDRVGENVQRGASINAMHEMAMTKHKVNRSNILTSSYDEYGVAVAVGDDGNLYLCQLFRGVSQ